MITNGTLPIKIWEIDYKTLKLRLIELDSGTLSSIWQLDNCFWFDKVFGTVFFYLKLQLTSSLQSHSAFTSNLEFKCHLIWKSTKNSNTFYLLINDELGESYLGIPTLSSLKVSIKYCLELEYPMMHKQNKVAFNILVSWALQI